MKIFKTLIVVTGLLCSSQAMACDVYINVINKSGSDVDSVSVGGPSARTSAHHGLDNGAAFTYHATGSLFNCHGRYHLNSSASQDACNYDDLDIYMSKDGTANFVITSVSGGATCNVTVSSVK
ncbi:MAG: hypothetical protein GY746_08775 [Gammaproteobacteria bacterium]|nr:hypothetical protein [Gammaproteobacteria bacterium]